MSRTSEILERVFPDELEGVTPARRHWWRRVDFGALKKKRVTLLVVAIGLLFVSMGVHYYNWFVVLETQVLADRAQIDAQLQRKKDLVIALAKTVEEYREYERVMFQYMADKRAGSLEKTDMRLEAAKEEGMLDPAKIKAGDLEGSLAKIIAFAEAYPSLKLGGNFQTLMDALVDTENRIVECRMTYNESCNAYQTYCRKVPQRVYVTLLGFEEYHFLKVDKDVELFGYPLE